MIGSCGPGSGGGLVATVLVSLAVLFAVFGALTVLVTVTVFVCGIGGGGGGPGWCARAGGRRRRGGGPRGAGEVVWPVATVGVVVALVMEIEREGVPE